MYTHIHVDTHTLVHTHLLPEAHILWAPIAVTMNGIGQGQTREEQQGMLTFSYRFPLSTWCHGMPSPWADDEGMG